MTRRTLERESERMTNSTGTVGGVGSSQGGQQGWDSDLNTQPIPPSGEGTTSAGTQGDTMATTRTTRTTKTDRERAEEQAQSVERDDNFQLPPGVSTKASRGEVETDTSEPEEEPLLTVEEQMAGGSEAQLEARSQAALAEEERARAEAQAR